MPIRTEQNQNLSPRERVQLDWEKEATKMQMALVERQDEAKVELERLKAEHDKQVRELEVEIKRLDVKWAALLRIPLNIVLLPVKLLMALAIPISAISGKPLSKEFWEIMK